MDSIRKLERYIYPCKIIDCEDYKEFPGASETEFQEMETDAFSDTSMIHIFLYLRNKGSKRYIEIYIYDVSLYPRSYRRYLISEGYRMSEEDEDALFAYSKERNPQVMFDSGESFSRLLAQIMKCYPHWNLRDYHYIFGLHGALIHMYYASSNSGEPHEILFMSGLWHIAFNLDKIPFNLMGKTVPELFGNMPLKLIQILNSPPLTDYMYSEEKMAQAKAKYERFLPYIGDEIPSSAQWFYLEMFTGSKNYFSRRKFNKELFDCLHEAYGKWSFDSYIKFLRYKERYPEYIKMPIPDADNVYSVVEKLEGIVEGLDGDEEWDLAIKERKNSENYEYTGDKYMIIMPDSFKSFALEALYQDNRLILDGYCYDHVEHDTTILFLRRKEQPEKSFVTMEVDKNGVIIQAREKDNGPVSSDVILFLEEYAKEKNLTVNLAT